MDEKALKALREARQRLVQINGTLRTGSVGMSKNNYAISLIDEVLPKEEIVVPKTYDADLVYPKQ